MRRQRIMGAMDSAELRLSVLGPVRAWLGDREAALGGPLERAVLAALALRPGLAVSRSWLVDAVWGERHPASALNSVHVYIGRLRRALEPVRTSREPGRVLVTEGSGYSLRIDPGQVDAEVFGRRLARARERRSAGDLDGALSELGEALGLWRGHPLDGIPGPQANLERTRLDELRVTAARERAEVLMALGRAAEAVPQVGALVSEYPVHEELRVLLMLALSRSGRQAEALAAYADARRVLAEELATEPGAELRRAHELVLAGDPGSGETPGPVTLIPLPVRDVPPVPRQLPAAVPDRQFAGRRAELDTLTGMLAGDAADGARPLAIIGITGMAGVGKTALALRWAHQVAAEFPDGQLYANLRGFDPAADPVSPSVVIRGFLNVLGVPADRIPAGQDGQAALYRSAMAGKRILILLDNARETAQVRMLLPGGPGCFVIVTSRDDLAALAATTGAELLNLDVFGPTESRDLLTLRLGAARVAAERDAVGHLAAACGGLPLALSVVAARAAVHPGFSLCELASELRDTRNRLEALDDVAAEDDPRAVFWCSYKLLSEPAARMFRLLGLHPGPDISLPAAASLAGTGRDQARSALAELTRAHLLTEATPGRFSFHDLLRAYAAELAADEDEEAEAERRGALHRIMDHYLHTGHAGAVLLQPVRDAISVADPVPGVAPERAAGYADAIEWFEAEHQVLMLVADMAVRTGFDTHAWQLAWSLIPFFYRRARWHDWAAVQRTALVAAERTGDAHTQARVHRSLGAACALLHDETGAGTHLWRAIDLYARVHDQVGEARARCDLAWMLDKRGEHHAAAEHATKALALSRAGGDLHMQAYALHILGEARTRLGKLHEALDCCLESLAVEETIGNVDGQAGAHRIAGHTYVRLTRYDQAIGSYTRAAALYEQLSDRYHQAEALVHLGDTHEMTGDPAAAYGAWQQAIAILSELGHPEADAVRARLTCRSGRATGQATEAGSRAVSADFPPA
jgi:DNA-binding SARP family transcriptional activator